MTDEIKEATEKNIDSLNTTIDKKRDQVGETMEKINQQLDSVDLKETAKNYGEQAREQAARVRDEALEQAYRFKDRVSDYSVAAGSDISRTVKNNPIPLAITAVGLGWLAYNGLQYRRNTLPDEYIDFYERDDAYGRVYDTEAPRQGKVEQYRDKLAAKSSSVKAQLGQYADEAREKAHQFEDQISREARAASIKARKMARHTRRELDQRFNTMQHNADKAVHDHPLAVGAVGLAVGVLVGLALPATRRENQLMGKARDQVLANAAQAADAYTREAQEKVDEAMSYDRAGNGVDHRPEYLS